MSKLHKAEYTGGIQYLFWCPACEHVHAVNHTWTFNGSMEFPTFYPSVRVTGYLGPKLGSGGVCHSFIQEGVIKYCADSTHAMAGQDVPMPEFRHP